MTIGNPRPPAIFSKACRSLNHHTHRQHMYSIGIKNLPALFLENLHGRTLALPGISRVNFVQLDRMAEVVCFIYWCQTDFDMLTEMFIRQHLSAINRLCLSPISYHGHTDSPWCVHAVFP